MRSKIKIVRQKQTVRSISGHVAILLKTSIVNSIMYSCDLLIFNLHKKNVIREGNLLQAIMQSRYLNLKHTCVSCNREINFRYFAPCFFDKWRKIFSIRKSNLFLILLSYIRKSIDKANFLLNLPAVTWNENLMRNRNLIGPQSR